MGMQVGGKYNFDDRGNIRFEIPHEESNIEIIDANVTVAGDELIFKFGDTGGSIERVPLPDLSYTPVLCGWQEKKHTDLV
jgi:hypothetical protein